jgi:hypothetical protein
MIARCHWKLSTISSFLIANYMNIRFTDINENINMKGFPALVYSLNVLFIICGSFVKEKLDRHSFQQGKNDKECLTQFQNIIKNILPCSILIISNGKVVFYNKETCRMLKFRPGTNLEERLGKIQILEHNRENYESNHSKIDTEAICIKSDPNNNQNLMDLLKKGRSDNFDCGFENLWGYILNEIPHHQPADEYEKCFDIKICKLSWEGSDAQMVMIAEDLLSQRVKYLSEQARYKDKLLATVSHDLRTPLNGVIGIIELVLETISDRWLRKK